MLLIAIYRGGWSKLEGFTVGGVQPLLRFEYYCEFRVTLRHCRCD